MWRRYFTAFANVYEYEFPIQLSISKIKLQVFILQINTNISTIHEKYKMESPP